MKLREIIDSKIQRLRNANDLQAGEAAKLLVEFSALMGNVNEEIKNAGDDYNLRYLSVIEEDEKTVAKAEIIMKVTPEYKRLEEAKAYLKLLLENIRSLKVFIKSKGSEQEGSYNL